MSICSSETDFITWYGYDEIKGEWTITIKHKNHSSAVLVCKQSEPISLNPGAQLSQHITQFSKYMEEMADGFKNAVYIDDCPYCGGYIGEDFKEDPGCYSVHHFCDYMREPYHDSSIYLDTLTNKWNKFARDQGALIRYFNNK